MNVLKPLSIIDRGFLFQAFFSGKVLIIKNNSKDPHPQNEKMGKLTNREDFLFVEIRY